MLSWRRGDAFQLRETWKDVVNGICELASKHEELENFLNTTFPLATYVFMVLLQYMSSTKRVTSLLRCSAKQHE